MNRWWGFALWALAGGLLALGAAGALTIGPLVLPVGVAVSVVAALVTRGVGAAGLLVGPAVVAASIGWLNRQGPGEVCTATDGAVECIEQWSPWPFYLAAIVLVAAAGALMWARRGRRPASV